VRLGVIDVGSNTARLLVVDAAHRGAAPVGASTLGRPLRLAQLLDEDGALSERGADELVDCVKAMRKHADELGVEDLAAFATSALREAANSDEVLAQVRSETGVALLVLAGQEEARLTFLAVRRWFGWSAGRLLGLDIGGGSLEVAAGVDEEPEVAVSVPLGAARLTRDWLKHDPPKRGELLELRRYVKATLAPHIADLYAAGLPDRVVVTSKTFRSLSRVAGVAPYGKGPHVRRTVTREQLAEVHDRVVRLPSAQRAELPGVSASRAYQLGAGAVVALVALDLLEVGEVEVCPWALREGVILRRLDQLTAG
jgi:exopolyphosphatase/guanosine-5'-triphosphate,3'-diphosphate pyrophosphatase